MIQEESANFPDYELLDSGDGYRLERFGKFVLARPDPAALWKKSLPQAIWEKADAEFIKQGEDKGRWKIRTQIPDKWILNYQHNQAKISFYAKLTPFKHTGVFPEQSANWDFIVEKTAGKKLNFLNLFGYTGIASVLAAKIGCSVTHVDASKPSVSWARENMLASGLPDDAIRWILDDALKFIKREVRRGKKYDAIILDPPAFGRGPKGEVWKFSDDLPVLLGELANLASPDFKYLICNAYAVSVSSLLLKNLLQDFAANAKLGPNRKIDYGELILGKSPNKLVSTGIFARLY
ncbi:hypothetical protein D4R52_02545 [bacterium]|nr:MAG: hypothetical protein D4R52_02545 [bacterium]